MRKAKIIIIVFNIFLLIFGAVILTVGLVNGGTLLFNVDYLGHRIVTAKEMEYITREEEVDDFKNFKIDVDASKVRINVGDCYKVKYQYYENGTPEIEVTDGTLNITLKHKSDDDHFGLNTLAFNKDKDEIIEITVPKEALLDNGTIDINYGNITIDDLAIKALSIDADASNIEMNNAKIAELKIENDFGNVDLNLIGERADYDIDLDVDAGHASIDGNTVKNDFKDRDGRRNKLEIEVDAGDISVEF